LLLFFLKTLSQILSFYSDLVEEHLLLFKTATRRDLYDEETAIFCARKIKDVRHLKMLYLLTVGDAIATGPKAWNEWTAALLKELFFKVLKILEHGELASRKAVKGVEEKKEKVLSSGFELYPKEELETLFNFMSPRYLLYTPASVFSVFFSVCCGCIKYRGHGLDDRCHGLDDGDDAGWPGPVLRGHVPV